MLSNRVVLITRIYKKTKDEVVALTQQRASEWIARSKSEDIVGVKYFTKEIWLV